MSRLSNWATIMLQHILGMRSRRRLISFALFPPSQIQEHPDRKYSKRHDTSHRIYRHLTMSIIRNYPAAIERTANNGSDMGRPAGTIITITTRPGLVRVSARRTTKWRADAASTEARRGYWFRRCFRVFRQTAPPERIKSELRDRTYDRWLWLQFRRKFGPVDSESRRGP